MVYIVTENIISPLGYTAEQNFDAVRQGRSELKIYNDKFESVEPFCASLLSETLTELNNSEAQLLMQQGYSRFETICILSAKEALNKSDNNNIASSRGTIFILSSTKGNIANLQDDSLDSALIYSAKKIADFFSNPNSPIVVSNACISGVNALIAAKRLLENKVFEHAVVIGADVQSQFIVSGFQSFKALSPQPCKPFDLNRTGLNLGEAAATILLSRSICADYCIAADAIHNDANHISGPSRTGEGSFRCLNEVKNNEVAFVNVHGTATAYNDEMESKALLRAEMNHLPINALKGYYGHTMGAAGILETILSLYALRQNIVLPTRGYAEVGTTVQLPISNTEQQLTSGNTAFVKLLSGFGGTNAAIRVEKVKAQQYSNTNQMAELTEIANISITPRYCSINSSTLPTEQQNADILVELYRKHVADYPKFFKMDLLSRLGFIASELLLQHVSTNNDENCSIILANSYSSVKNDRDYQASISDPHNYYPSPSLFVYTLPNIVTGEIAIRNHFLGETSFYLLPTQADFYRLLPTLLPANCQTAICGWVEATSAQDFKADLHLYKINKL